MPAMKKPSASPRQGSSLTVLLFLLTSCVPAVAQVSPGSDQEVPSHHPGTIQVTGQAQVSVPADVAKISLTVETEAASAAEAIAENARKMEAALAAIRSLSVSGLDVETYGYSLRPEYQVSREGTGIRSISGYRAQNNIRVTVPEVEATGEVLDRAVEAGANRVANLQFEASDTREPRLEALREAVIQAREQAEAIAEAMGVSLGPALEVQGGANVPGPLPSGALFARAAAESTTPVEGGDQLVNASVTITYQILEGGS